MPTIPPSNPSFRKEISRAIPLLDDWIAEYALWSAGILQTVFASITFSRLLHSSLSEQSCLFPDTAFVALHYKGDGDTELGSKIDPILFDKPELLGRTN